ncbi:MAG: hypothetical protein EOP90_04530 [Lysobacteraceae bacterium]|nr:MAG: hypothetical protein EOP90_04530 [Xanthomonadaceae bacterium]
MATPLALQPVHAGEPPRIGPQWVTSFWREVIARDDLASADSRSWFRTEDGGAVVVTLDRNLLMRRFSADGSVRQAQWLRPQEIGLGEGIDRVAVAADPSAAGFYMLVRSHHCRLVRTSPEFRPRWSVPVPALVSDSESCEDLHVLPDGSVLTLRTSTLARIRADGTVAWTARGGHAFVVDAQHVAWVAGRGEGATSTSAAVSRFDLDGQLLSRDEFLCANCSASTALAIDALPGGDVMVGGGSGYLEPGFLARYDASGMRRLWIDSDVGVRYSRVVHDLEGSVYVMAESEGQASRVRRVDAVSGLVQWEVPANDVVALPDGIAVIRRSASGVLAVGVGPAGQTRWTSTVSTHAGASVSRPSARDGEFDLLVQEPVRLSPACGTAPRLLSFDLDGKPGAAMRACTMPLLRSVLAFDFAPSLGVLARLETELVRLDDGGAERWRASTCNPCSGTSSDDAWAAGVLAPDGGGWGVRVPGRPLASADRRPSIERIHADGTSAFSIPIEPATSNEPSTRVFAMPDRALVLVAATQRLVWRSVGDAGEVLGLHEHPMADDAFEILAAQAHADGSVSVIASGETPCYGGCTPFTLSVLRIAPDGQLAWRHDFPDAHWKAALAPDGTSMLVSPGDHDGDPLLLRRIDADGTLAAPMPLGGVPPLHFAIFFVGPASGQWLLTTGGAEPWELALWSLDEQGEVSAARFDLPEESRGYGEDGFVFSVVHDEGPRMHLLDPRSLAPRVQFPHGGGEPYGTEVLPWDWRQLPDGTAYSSWTLPGYTLGLARYALPWGVPQDRLFRNGFE